VSQNEPLRQGHLRRGLRASPGSGSVTHGHLRSGAAARRLARATQELPSGSGDARRGTAMRSAAAPRLQVDGTGICLFLEANRCPARRASLAGEGTFSRGTDRISREISSFARDAARVRNARLTSLGFPSSASAPSPSPSPSSTSFLSASALPLLLPAALHLLRSTFVLHDAGARALWPGLRPPGRRVRARSCRARD
jgi:hypothetical protein